MIIYTEFYRYEIGKFYEKNAKKNTIKQQIFFSAAYRVFGQYNLSRYI